MKLSELLFVLLRKSTNALKNYAQKDSDRKSIIRMKCAISSLDPILYKLLKTIANNPDRFVIHNFDKLQEILKNGVLVGPVFPKLNDTELDIDFYFSNKGIHSNGVLLFSGEDYFAFIGIVFGLYNIKQREDDFFVQRKKQELRNNVLSRYQ